MKKAWLLVVAVVLVTGAAVIAHRESGIRKNSSASGTSSSDPKASGSASSGAISPPASSALIEVSQRGPGMRRQSPDTLKLPVPRTLDLTHVTAANFATALGDDPARIFNYVRDEIAYETYTGCLRGPRGTLLALAGNSVDRASLLASMLQHAGQRVRFAHGTLPEPLARELVTSMWAERPQPASSPDLAPSSAAKTAAGTLLAGVKRDYTLIRDQLKNANVITGAQSAPTLDSLVKEAQDHYWVQWSKAGTWVDLDPSFIDSSPGTKYAPVERTLEAFPDALFHKIEIRLRLEEYTGDKVSSRVILSRKANAADLSGMNIVLSHQPENWSGPAASLEGALSSAIQETGRVKPVLIVGEKDWFAGETFYPKSPPSGGMGGVFNALAGIGTRHDAPIATAESLEFDFIPPTGQKETVIRELFDLVGRARRAKGSGLTGDEVRARAGAADRINLADSIYGLFFDTGAIAENYLLAAHSTAKSEESDVRATLQALAVTFNLMSDSLTGKLGSADEGKVCFYFDAPRLTIIDVSKGASGEIRLGIDLRRDTPRGVVQNSNPQASALSRVERGVVDGNLERVLLDYLMALAPRNDGQSDVEMSTSSLFDDAEKQHVPAAVLPADRNRLAADIPEDTLARLNDDTAKGYVAIAPEHVVRVAGLPRYAWWRVDPKSGETVAVTDEGLYGVELVATFKKNVGGQVIAVFVYIQTGIGAALKEALIDTIDPKTFPGGIAAVLRLLRDSGVLTKLRP